MSVVNDWPASRHVLSIRLFPRFQIASDFSAGLQQVIILAEYFSISA